MFDGIPPSQDSKLLIQDLVFDDVPVRLYWLKTPVAGQRRGMLYLHGGAGLIGSIRKFFGRNLDVLVRWFLKIN